MSSSGDNYGGSGDWSSDPWGQGDGQDQWGQGQGGGQQPWGPPTQDWGAAQQGGGQPPQPTQGWGQPGQPGQAPPGQGWGGQSGQPGQPQWGPPPGQPGAPGQPGWGGQPGQPQWGAPGGVPPYQGGPPRKSNKGLIIGLAAGGGGLVLVIVVVLVLVFALGGGGGGGGTGGGGDDGGGGVSGGERTASWNVPEPDSEDAATLLRSYVTDNVLVRASGAGLTAYNISNGKVKWNLPVPDGSAICAAAPDAPNKIAAIVFGSDDHCTTVAAVNIETGKQAWSATPKVQSEYFDPSEAAVAAGGGKVYVSNEERVWAYNATSGDSLWWAAPKNDDCHTGDVAASDKGVLATVNCSLDDQYGLVKLNPENGKSIWNAQIQSDEDYPQPLIMSVSPPVIHLDNASDNGELRVFDDNGKQTHRISSRGEGGDLVLRPSVGGSYDDLHRGFPVEIVGTTLVALVDNSDDTEASAKAVGVDLTTGKRAWIKDLGSSNDYLIVDGAADDKKVQVVDSGDYDTDPQLKALDVQNRGAISEGDTFATPDSISYLSAYSTQFMAASDTLFQLKTSESGDEPIIIAYK
ncbi:MAG: PQQ-binding-like beta-propeller repeat protein [Streptosporangiales bacterium]